MLLRHHAVLSSCLLTSTRGAYVPKLLYATAWKQEGTPSLVERALTLGLRANDTACQAQHYDEPGVGAGVAAAYRALRLDRERLHLRTKFTPVGGQSPDSMAYDADASPAEQVRQSCAASLTHVRTTYLDGLILHSPTSPSRIMLQHWRAMEGLVTSGIVRQLGISNCYELATLEALWGAATIKPLIEQNRFYANTAYARRCSSRTRTEHGPRTAPAR